jgi:hypothetical protein
MQSTVLLVIGKNALAFAIFHKQIKREVFDEVVGIVSERLAVECVEESVSGSVSGSTASVCLSSLSKLLRLTSESTLVTVKVSLDL